MDKKLRYIFAWVLGISISIFAWYQIAMAHPIFAQLGESGLVAPIVSSLLAGFVVSVVSPNHKVSMSVAVGFVVALPILLFLLRDGLSHFGRNPFFWYWPVYVVPFFSIGGFLGRGIWRDA